MREAFDGNSTLVALGLNHGGNHDFRGEQAANNGRSFERDGNRHSNNGNGNARSVRMGAPVRAQWYPMAGATNRSPSLRPAADGSWSKQSDEMRLRRRAGR